MPYVAGFESDEVATATTSKTVTMPTHQNNDILIVFANKDTAATFTETSASGWTLFSQEATTGAWNGVWWKRATGSSETAATFTWAVETANFVTVCVRGAHQTNAPVKYKSSIDSTIPFSQNASITTPSVNCLALHGCGGDAIQGCTPFPANGQVLYAGDSGANGIGVAWKFYPTTSSTVTTDWFSGLADDVAIYTIIIEDDGSNSVVQGYVPTTGVVMDTLTSGATLFGWSYPASLSLASIGGKNTTFDAIGSTGDTGINPYHASMRITPSKSTTNLGGSEMLASSAKDWSSGYLLFTSIFATPAEWKDVGTFTQGGITVTMLDTGNDYRSWKVGAKQARSTLSDERNYYAIQPAQNTSTFWASSGTFNSDVIDTVMFLCAPYTNAVSMNFASLLKSGVATLAGGVSSSPLNFIQLVDAYTNGHSLVPIVQARGSSATVWMPLKIGGSDPVHVDINLRTFQFPKAYDEATGDINWHVDADQVGIDFDARSGDTCSFTNCTFTSDSRYYWRINASASASATWDFAGTSIAGALVTLRDVTTFDRMAFVNSTMDISNCDLTNCSLSSPPNTNNSLTTNASTTIDSSSIDVTSLSAGNYLCSVASPSIFTNNEFTGSSSTGHAIRITTPGTYSFVGNTFTGFGSIGTTSAAIYNDSGGAVTINISGGGSTPTYRNGASATTTINNSVTLTVNVTRKDTGAAISGVQVIILKTSDLSTIDSGTTNGSGVFSASYNYTVDTDVTISVRKSTLPIPRFFADEAINTILTSGMNQNFQLRVDTIATQA